MRVTLLQVTGYNVGCMSAITSSPEQNSAGSVCDYRHDFKPESP